MYQIRNFNTDLSAETEFEKVSEKPSKVEANQCMSVRDILNKFVATGEVPPDARAEQIYGEDITARPDFDLLDAKEKLAEIDARFNKLYKDKLAKSEAARLAALREQIKKELEEEQATKPVS